MLAYPSRNPGSRNPGSRNPGSRNPGSRNPGSRNPGSRNPGSRNPGSRNPGARPCPYETVNGGRSWKSLWEPSTGRSAPAGPGAP